MSEPNRGIGQLVVERAPDGDRLVLKLRGELDLASAGSLESELQAAASDGFRDLVIDLSGLAFMDSTGIGLLVRAQVAAQENQHKLSLRRGPAQVQRVLEITGLADRMPFEN
jgi:anti-anti-sigma factor